MGPQWQRLGGSREGAALVRLALAISMAAGVWAGFLVSSTWGQEEAVELIRTDITKLNALNSSQWAVLGVRLGESRETALGTLQRTSNIRVKEDPSSGRIFVYAQSNSPAVIMSVKIVQGMVTAINLLGGFSEWLQGETRLLFRAFEDDSLRYKLLGREDQREAVRGGTKAAPTLDVTYAYFKEGILLHYSAKSSADGKQIETQRELVLIYPAKPR